ncbi:hypothetical protein CBS147339_4920 [Penicillium roqueforti]|nr:hypothetical protein CBS147339_4920 [Penicillium roqueforti]KAI3103499.1 hypothetical protein CBS147338_2028 [Penicillium roqueforti]KAI3146578.1 hypothetical protein CBS147325_4459 [Penicillium roqueforti]KAI3186795.1 hypothetical protein DTO032C6_4285 [Penicillium roqueforti]
MPREKMRGALQRSFLESGNWRLQRAGYNMNVRDDHEANYRLVSSARLVKFTNKTPLVFLSLESNAKRTNILYALASLYRCDRMLSITSTDYWWHR